MTGKRYKSVGANLECSNGKEYMLVKRDDGFNVCQVCSKYTAKEIVDELNNLADENEQLKKELKVYRKVASCSNCKYHNYDWDIDDGYGGEEYEVCDKGNDVTDMICEEWEEL